MEACLQECPKLTFFDVYFGESLPLVHSPHDYGRKGNDHGSVPALVGWAIGGKLTILAISRPSDLMASIVIEIAIAILSGDYTKSCTVSTHELILSAPRQCFFVGKTVVDAT